MEELIPALVAVGLELSLFWFACLWFEEMLVWIHMIKVGIYVAGATILLISTFGQHETIITYRLPNDEEMREIIIKLP